MESTESGAYRLKKKLEERLANFDQVEVFLQADPQNAELQKLRIDLMELIVMISREILASDVIFPPKPVENQLASLKNGLASQSSVIPPPRAPTVQLEESSCEGSEDEGTLSQSLQLQKGGTENAEKTKNTGPIATITSVVNSDIVNKYDDIDARTVRTITEDELLNNWTEIYKSQMPKRLVNRLRSTRTRIRQAQINANREKEGLPRIKFTSLRKRKRKKATKGESQDVLGTNSVKGMMPEMDVSSIWKRYVSGTWKDEKKDIQAS